MNKTLLFVKSSFSIIVVNKLIITNAKLFYNYNFIFHALYIKTIKLKNLIPTYAYSSGKFIVIFRILFVRNVRNVI